LRAKNNSTEGRQQPVISEDAIVESNLFALAYVSRRNPYEGGLSLEGTLRSILSTSRRNNSLFGITGALMVSHSNFSQIIEGKREAVDAIFSKIQCDSRHRDLRVLYVKRIAKRDFPHWSMAMGGISNHPTLCVDAAISDPYGAAATKIRTHLVSVLQNPVEEEESGLLRSLKIPIKPWENVRDVFSDPKYPLPS